MRPTMKRKEALNLKLKKFYNGKLCPYGHDAERWSTSGRCVICTKEQKVDVVKRRACEKRFYKRNREKRALHSKKWREQNPALAEFFTLQWRAKNQEKMKLSYKKYSLNNKEKIRARDHKNRAQRLSVEGFFTKNDILSILQEQNYLCIYCQRDLKKIGYHIDHRIPITKRGTNWPINLQCLCQRCNLRKGNKGPYEFILYLNRVELPEETEDNAVLQAA